VIAEVFPPYLLSTVLSENRERFVSVYIAGFYLLHGVMWYTLHESFKVLHNNIAGIDPDVDTYYAPEKLTQ